jgi:hypothetical protein
MPIKKYNYLKNKLASSVLLIKIYKFINLLFY